MNSTIVMNNIFASIHDNDKLLGVKQFKELFWKKKFRLRIDNEHHLWFYFVIFYLTCWQRFLKQKALYLFFTAILTNVFWYFLHKFHQNLQETKSIQVKTPCHKIQSGLPRSLRIVSHAQKNISNLILTRQHFTSWKAVPIIEMRYLCFP